ncbi:transmembrane protease serine 3-like, partial [Centruroides sculpturatus]|uniref:transmembrane protease serine 3-like n=1 Tax=Centruroides sculpturatus TaxID=218467 RepID=UPI000C6E89BC
LLLFLSFRGKVYPIRSFSAVVGNVNRSLSSTKVSFSSIIIHKEYKSFRVKNDIALCKLSTPLQFDENTQAVCIPNTNQDFVGKMALAMGWGNTRRINNRIPELLQVVKVDISSHRWCSFIYWVAGLGTIYLSKNQLCAGSLMVGVCNGDSGGPLILDEGDRNITVGITSFGTWAGCAPLGIPAVYTAINRYVKWIKDNVDEDFCIVDLD